MLRQMSPDDLPEVNLLLSKAFTHGYLQDGLRNRRVPLCTRSFLDYYLNANPEGALVIEEDGGLTAFCFSRIWGTTAWIGPLSVGPEQEGKGYGCQIVNACIEQLQDAGAVTIGLEMSAVSARNLAFYTKLGFEVDCPTVDMVRPLPQEIVHRVPECDILRFGQIEPSGRAVIMRSLRWFSGAIQPGLDYSQEILRCIDSGMGDAIILKQHNQIVALMIAHTEIYSAEEKRQFLKVNILQIQQEVPIHILDTCIDVLEMWARETGLDALYIRVPARYDDAFCFLLRKEFRIAQNDLRLTLRGFGLQEKPGSINLSKWE